MTASTVLSERLKRQGLMPQLRSRKDYLPLFRQLQPVSPVHFSYPGSPPGLVHRTTFDHHKEADRLRGNRTLIKGRFLGGGIGYVCADDLAIYATAFRRPIKKMNWIQQDVFAILDEMGPLTPRQIKEETRLGDDAGLRNKDIMPALHRLQEAFLVFEDQHETDWERDWNTFASEWPDVDLEALSWEDAVAEVLRRFVSSQVFVTLEQVKDWSGFSLRVLKSVMAEMENRGDLLSRLIDGLGEGWLCADAGDLKPAEVPKSVFMLHKADPLVKSHATELKGRFGDQEVLQYVLIDGVFAGAVLGHWRIGPHDVDDILVELPLRECTSRKAEIIEAVAWGYQSPRHHILAYNGKPLNQEQ